MAVIDIANADEFSLLLKDLGLQIIEAGWHWKLCTALDAARGTYSKEFNQSPTFWSLTFAAHEDATLFRLCRVYEANDKSLNLRNLLETIRANMSMFEVDAFRERLKNNPFVESLAADARKPDAAQLEEDLEFATENIVVKHLHAWRNNSLAHRSPSFAMEKLSLSERFPIMRTEVQGLVDGARGVLNRYSSMFNATHDSAMLIGANDFKTSLDAVRADLERRDREEHELLRKYTPDGS